MTEGSGSGDDTGRKRGNPPIVVPKGGKYSSRRSPLRRIKDLFSFQPSGAETEKKAAPDENEPKGRSTRAPVERATVHMLPGRLRPVDPEVLQQEIRFLRVAGSEQVFTLGWKIGNPPAHITLNHSSVKPLHARMTFREGSWWIESLHRLDPVTVDGDPVPFGDPPRKLEDGDAVCLGAVLFRFGFP
jgi:hypothetical protein